MREKSIRLFWSRVRKTDGCWLWLGHLIKGYGSFHTPTKRHTAHRLAYELLVGPIPDGLYLCHRCDNRKCVNPAHLFIGTHQDNMRDMRSKGRSKHSFWGRDTASGSKNNRAKLSEPDVVAIRNSAMTNREVADAYRLDMSTVHDLRARHTWRHVE